MNATLTDVLPKLATMDAELLGLRRRLRQLPLQMAEAEQNLQTESTALEVLETPYQALQGTVREKELTVQVALETIAKFEEHMKRASTQKSYAAAQRQVDEARKMNQRLQDEIIEARIELEKMAPDVKEAQTRHLDAETALTKIRTTLDAEKTTLTTKAAVLEKKIERCAREADGVYPYYQRLHKNRKAPAVVAVFDGTCSGCQIRVPPKDFHALIAKADQLHTCPQCQRIIFSLPPAEPTTEPEQPAAEKPSA